MNKEPRAIHPSRSSTRVAVVVLVACSMLVVGAVLWTSGPALPPPEIPLDTVEAPVAEAIARARGEVQRTPRSAEAWGNLGMVLLAHDFRDQAALCLAQAEQLDLRDPRWPYLQGAATSGNADPDTVLAPLRRAVERAASEPVARLRLAEVLLEQGHVDESEQLFRDVLREDPSEPRAHLGMGRIMRSRGDFRASIDHLTTSLTRAPRVRQSYVLLTEVYHRVGDTANAERSRREMQRLPDAVLWPDPYLEQVMSREVGIVALISRVDSFLQGNQHDLALKLLQQASAVHPDSAEVHFQLWRILHSRKQFAEADRELQMATRLAADSVQAHYYQGIAYALKGEHSSAVAAFQKTLELNPQFGSAYCDLGESLYALGERTRAIEAFRASVRYRPNLARARVHLAKALAAEGWYQEALEHLELADSLQTLDSSARLLLEDIKHRAGEREGR